MQEDSFALNCFLKFGKDWAKAAILQVSFPSALTSLLWPSRALTLFSDYFPPYSGLSPAHQNVPFSKLPGPQKGCNIRQAAQARPQRPAPGPLQQASTDVQEKIKSTFENVHTAQLQVELES